MNIIDISSWQSGIDLPTLFDKNPLDGVIVKATQGTGYVNPEFAKWTKWLAEHDKPFGFYHYLDGVDAAAEARHFYETVRPYIGTGIPVADYEDPATAKGTAWLKLFLDTFRELSGVRCLIYCSLSVVQTQGFAAIADAGYKLWVAQYADMNPVHGFLDNPWQKGSVSPFNSYIMHQYTSCGRLYGYGGNLDFDLFKGSYATWVEMARGEETPSSPLKPASPTVVLDVLKGKYGTESDTPPRSARLREDGFDPDSVQSTINRLYVVAGKVKQDIGNDMSYLNAILWIARS